MFFIFEVSLCVIGLFSFFLAPASLSSAPTKAEQICIEGLIDEEFKKFNPELLDLLDVQKNSFLFRGNLPEGEGKFSYDLLIESIKNYLEKHQVHFQKDFELIDLSLLNYFIEADWIEIEKNWFIQHPDTGYFLLNPLYGNPFDPTCFSEPLRNLILTHHDVDGLQKLIPKIKEIVMKSGEKKSKGSSRDRVVYIHSNAGKDRTGEAASCYLMEYKGMSYKDVIILNQKIIGREIRTLSKNAIRWYAYYLRDIKKLSSVGDID